MNIKSNREGTRTKKLKKKNNYKKKDLKEGESTQGGS